MSTSAVSRIVTVVLGEALVDVVHRADGSVARLPGGSGANTALALSRLGCATMFATCLGSDDDGRMILDRLRDSGVDLVVEPAQRTSTAEAHLRVDGSADYTFDVSWQPPVELPAAPDHLHAVGGAANGVLRGKHAAEFDGQGRGGRASG
ncbi:MAG: PfkB family carbohydrate kinase [Nocardioides sp.]|nr:PfkB family carbohydrate kinase [Nocardioides sp.]